MRFTTSIQTFIFFFEKMQNLDSNSKSQLFKTIKTGYTFENYLLSKNLNFRKLICKFRISDHLLAIEKGRYLKLPRDKRLCGTCNKIEDETYFFFDCLINKNRELYFQKLNLDTFSSLAVKKNLHKFESPPKKNDEQVKLLGSFLKQSVALRTGGI